MLGRMFDATGEAEKKTYIESGNLSAIDKSRYCDECCRGLLCVMLMVLFVLCCNLDGFAWVNIGKAKAHNITTLHP